MVEGRAAQDRRGDDLHIAPFRDDAYRATYRDSPYLGPMIGARACSATVKVMPRDTEA